MHGAMVGLIRILVNEAILESVYIDPNPAVSMSVSQSQYPSGKS